MRYDAEVRIPPSKLEDALPSDSDEYKLIQRLIGQFTKGFNAEEYTDEQTERVEKLIQVRLAGGDVADMGESAPVTDESLLEQLRAAVEEEE